MANSEEQSEQGLHLFVELLLLKCLVSDVLEVYTFTNNPDLMSFSWNQEMIFPSEK